MDRHQLRNFYIPEEQSFYLLNTNDAQKMRDWVALCISELTKLGYRDIALVGKGAYGFAFAGIDAQDRQCVFKFSRLNLPLHIQERLADEAFMLSQCRHPQIPAFYTYQIIGKQGILMMGRAPGVDLEQYSLQKGRLSVREVLTIASQLAALLLYLRRHQRDHLPAPIVHGDIKPSNVVYDPTSGHISLVDWGSSVFAQLDEQGQYISQNVMQLMSADLQHSNARMGDVYFIGQQQRQGALSSPRFDEQGVAGTLYALASGQSCRFGYKAIPARCLGLPREFATILDSMLSDDMQLQRRAGDYFIQAMPRLKHLVTPDLALFDDTPCLPVQWQVERKVMDTVVYSSRKSFLREHSLNEPLIDVDDVQLERYYRQFLDGMGDTEKAFIAAVSRLARYPLVGGLVVHWMAQGIYIDCNLNVSDQTIQHAFAIALNNMVTLARAISKVGVFKACFFDARQTIHLSRVSMDATFTVPPNTHIQYQLESRPWQELSSKQHSYFEDGKDPDEQLELPDAIMAALAHLNLIRHSGCIIFEVSQLHMKIHSYFLLYDSGAQHRFSHLLQTILAAVPAITGEGVGGFMKLPHKDTRFFQHQLQPDICYYPADPTALHAGLT